MHYDAGGLSPGRRARSALICWNGWLDILRTKDSRAGFEATPDMLSITGMTLEQFSDLMGGLGYKGEKSERPKLKAAPVPVPVDPEAPVQPIPEGESAFIQPDPEAAPEMECSTPSLGRRNRARARTQLAKRAMPRQPSAARASIVAPVKIAARRRKAMHLLASVAPRPDRGPRPEGDSAAPRPWQGRPQGRQTARQAR